MKKLLNLLSLVALGISSALLMNATTVSAPGLESPIRYSSDGIKAKIEGIEVHGPFHVLVTIGNKEEVRIESDKEKIGKIETKIEGGVLKIRFKNGGKKLRMRLGKLKLNFGHHENMKIFVTVCRLSSLYVSGSGSIKVEQTVEGKKISSFVTGSGSITVNANVNSYAGAISGSGSIVASGIAKHADLKISGSGSFRGKNLAIENADLRVRGSGCAMVHVENKLKVDLSGSGKVRYNGNPHLNVLKSGSGNISKL